MSDASSGTREAAYFFNQSNKQNIESDVPSCSTVPQHIVFIPTLARPLRPLDISLGRGGASITYQDEQASLDTMFSVHARSHTIITCS